MLTDVDPFAEVPVPPKVCLGAGAGAGFEVGELVASGNGATYFSETSIFAVAVAP